MNCKIGDIAVIIRTHPDKIEYLGKVIAVVAWAGDYWQWETDFIENDSTLHVDDKDLRPIRDSDKEDEMLSIVNLKEKVKS